MSHLRPSPLLGFPLSIAPLHASLLPNNSVPLVSLKTDAVVGERMQLFFQHVKLTTLGRAVGGTCACVYVRMYECCLERR